MAQLIDDVYVDFVSSQLKQADDLVEKFGKLQSQVLVSHGYYSAK